jgi:hypothetical protein
MDGSAVPELPAHFPAARLARFASAYAHFLRNAEWFSVAVNSA